MLSSREIWKEWKGNVIVLTASEIRVTFVIVLGLPRFFSLRPRSMFRPQKWDVYVLVSVALPYSVKSFPPTVMKHWSWMPRSNFVDTNMSIDKGSWKNSIPWKKLVQPSYWRTLGTYLIAELFCIWFCEKHLANRVGIDRLSSFWLAKLLLLFYISVIQRVSAFIEGSPNRKTRENCSGFYSRRVHENGCLL